MIDGRFLSNLPRTKHLKPNLWRIRPRAARNRGREFSGCTEPSGRESQTAERVNINFFPLVTFTGGGNAGEKIVELFGSDAGI